jgi:hypothetical protein
MAKQYRLIVKDVVFEKVRFLAEKRGKSLGKTFNDLIEYGLAVVNLEEKMEKPICAVCGEKASILVLGKGEQLFCLCELHEPLCQKFPAFKPIEKKENTM